MPEKFRVCKKCKVLALAGWIYCPKCGSKIEEISLKEFVGLAQLEWVPEWEFAKIWEEAKGHLRKHGYSITLTQLEEAMPDIRLVASEPTDFEGKVKLLIHEAVEVEEIQRKTGKWMNPRDYYDQVREKTGKIEIGPHVKAEEIEARYPSNRNAEKWERKWKEKEG